MELMGGCRGGGVGRGVRCYFMIMPSLCTPTNEGSERMRDAKPGREERAKSPSPAPTWVGVLGFFLLLLLFSVFSVTRSFCFSQLALHADRMVIFIAIIALNLRVHL